DQGAQIEVLRTGSQAESKPPPAGVNSTSEAPCRKPLCVVHSPRRLVHRRLLDDFGSARSWAAWVGRSFVSPVASLTPCSPSIPSCAQALVLCRHRFPLKSPVFFCGISLRHASRCLLIGCMEKQSIEYREGVMQLLLCSAVAL
ncbi:unnamed protein product, partial [Discosporangium mesarthrocarpum]